ncbi:MAG TPA: RNA polymerase sigma factor [Candidatus Cybelea sp.]
MTSGTGSSLDDFVAHSPTATAQSRVESLVIEHQTKLARYLRRMVGDAETALDLSQDVFLSAYRMLSADPARELRVGWLYRAATNAAISLMRRRKILHVLSLDRDLDGSSWRIDERSAASIDLQTALKRLPSEQAAALLMTSYAGYSSAEAAQILGSSADAVRQRVCRAMKTLRQVMNEENGS